MIYVPVTSTRTTIIGEYSVPGCCIYTQQEEASVTQPQSSNMPHVAAHSDEDFDHFDLVSFFL